MRAASTGVSVGVVRRVRHRGAGSVGNGSSTEVENGAQGTGATRGTVSRDLR